MTAVVPRGGLSIRARLAMWYASSVLLVFLVFAFALRVTVRTALRNEFTSAVTSSGDAIGSFFRLEYAEYRDVNATITHIANEVVFPDRIVEFVTPRDSVVFRVGPNKKGSSSSRTPSEVNGVLLPPLVRVESPLDTAIAKGWRLRVLASAAPLERSLALIDQWLIIGIPLGFLLAGATGWWLAGRTLRPVAAMAEAATRMAVERRSESHTNAVAAAQRLPIDNPSDELGRLGTRFNALLDQLDGVVGQQRRFLADAAHELRTPVARMMGNVDLALLDPHDAAAQSDALRRVRTDLERAARLVDELLQLARADAAGNVSLRAAYLDDVVVDAVHAWQPVAERKGVQLTLSAFDETPARIDPVYLERLVGILLDNAIRYTPAGGSVLVNVDTTNGAPQLTVADSGMGIADADRSRIFERFDRSASARLMSADGSGLGLPIARWIAQAHAATLELTARSGGGTVATLSFPATEPATQQLIAARPA